MSATATNNRKKDARLSYMMGLASSRLPRVMELCTYVGGNRDDFFAVDVICTEVLEHVLDTQRAFRELARMTKIGGYLLITTPFMYPLHEEPNDFVRLTPYQIRRHAAINNLDVVGLELAGNEFEVIATVWNGFLSNGVTHRTSVLTRLWVASLRLVANLSAMTASAMFNRRIPQKAYLNVMCVLRKREV